MAFGGEKHRGERLLESIRGLDVERAWLEVLGIYGG